jgi:glycosyltransferase involved in cell wall biosynthesis
MRIVMIGREDPGGMMIGFTNAINRLTEHQARSIVLDAPRHAHYQIDIMQSELMQEDDYGEIEHLLTQADIIHFHMLIDENVMIGPLCLRDYVHGKRFLHHHHGHHDLFVNASSFTEKYRKLDRRVIVSTPDLLKILPDATWQPNLVPIHQVHYLPRYDHLNATERVKIVQAPTRKWQKQTAVFRKVTDELRNTYPQIELYILTDIPQAECLRFKRNCHISFDHMNGWFGIASLESLAHGLPTVAGLDDWNIECIQNFTGTDEVPWVVARSEDELREKLAKLGHDIPYRVAIGQGSRRFMENHWTEQHALDVLLQTYESL